MYLRRPLPTIRVQACLVVLSLLLLFTFTTTINAQTYRIRICVPETVYEDCLQMSDNIPGTFACINARDKYECMTLIDRDEADIVNLDAEDLYLAGRLYDLEPFLLEENNGNLYLQRSAVIVPKTSRINSIAELKGKRACLGPYNSHLTWNAPIGLLLASETMVPDCRGEIYTTEAFFGESCAAGNWSHNLHLDDELKRNNPRLCSLCKDAIFACSENDMFAGPDGTLKCMVEGRGEVAFTTIDTALDYFARRPLERENYEFLCLDGSRMGINSRGCHWTRQPTNSFVIRKGRERNKEIYMRMLQQIYIRFVKLRPSWFDKSFVSSSNVTQLTGMPYNQGKWNRYLEYYIPSIEKPLQGCFRRNITFCLSKKGELSKCQQLQKAAISRRIRPLIQCFQADSDQACIRMLNERRADLMIMSPDKFYHAARYQSLEALAREQLDVPRYGVAVVRSNSDITTFEQLRGRRSCHTGFGDLASWLVPIGALIQDGQVETTRASNSCNRAQIIVDFFHRGSCVPGAADARINPNGTGVEHLCSQCIGDERGEHVCNPDTGERYSGEEGALRCLVEGRGDVAFLSHDTVARYTDGHSALAWAHNLKASDFRLLCRQSIQFVRSPDFPFDDILSSRPTTFTRTLSHALISDFARCHVASIPGSIVATSLFTPRDVKIDALLLLTQLSQTFLQNHRDSFRLASVFRNQSNLIFADSTSSIQPVRAETSFQEALGSFLPFLESNDPIACGCLSVWLNTSTAIMLSSLFFYIFASY